MNCRQQHMAFLFGRQEFHRNWRVYALPFCFHLLQWFFVVNFWMQDSACGFQFICGQSGQHFELKSTFADCDRPIFIHFSCAPTSLPNLSIACACFFSVSVTYIWFLLGISPWKSVNNYAKTHSLSHSITIVLICSPSTISLFLFSHFFSVVTAVGHCVCVCVCISMLVFHSTWIRSFFSHFYRIPHCNANQFRKVTSTAKCIHLWME